MSWSSKQRLSKEDLASLQNVLLDLLTKLEKKAYNSPDTMINTTSGDLTQTTSIRNMLKDTLTSLGND